jgi:hypothetical protein
MSGVKYYYPLVDLPSNASDRLLSWFDDFDEGLVGVIKKRSYRWKAQVFSTHNIPISRLLEYKRGGFYEPDSPHRWPTSSLEWVKNYFLDFSKLYSDGLCLFQDLGMTPGDFEFHPQTCSGGFFLDNVTYCSVAADSFSTDKLEDTLREVGARFNIFAVFFHDQKQFPNLHESMKFNGDLSAILTSAYDDEGYILYTPV